MKKSKKIFLIAMMAIIVLIILILFIPKYGLINNILKVLQNQQTQDIKFQVYSNQDNILKILVTVQDTEYGINKLSYINKDGEKVENSCYNKKEVSIDYEIDIDGEYTFKATNGIGKEFESTLIVNDEFRNNLINIKIDTETEIATNGTVTIDYHGNENKKRMYKIGENGNWIDYTGQFTIDSYDIIQNNLQNKETKTVTIYAKIEDEAKNVVSMEKIATNIDVDIAEVPVITYIGEDRNTILTKYGIYLDENVNVNINYDKRTDITNYYSFDNGKTWNLYTGEIETNETNIIAKSVKNNSGLEIIEKQNCNDILSNENIQAEAYDEKLETYTYATNRYILLDSDLVGYNVKLYLNCPQWNHVNIVFYKEDEKTRVGDTGYWHTSNSLGYLKLTIPEEAKYIKIIPTSEGHSYYCELYNIELDTEPIGNTFKLYPYMNISGIKNDNKYTIEYFETAVKKLYSLDDKNWYDYPEEGISLNLNETVYAKSIDKNGKESIKLTYKNTLTDILDVEAYDNDDETKAYAYNKILYIDPELWNKQIRIKLEAELFSRVSIMFLDENNEIITEYSRANGMYDENYTIPENTRLITWKYTDGNGAASYIYDIRFIQ